MGWRRLKQTCLLSEAEMRKLGLLFSQLKVLLTRQMERYCSCCTAESSRRGECHGRAESPDGRQLGFPL